MTINIDGLTESEGFDLFHRLKAKFDWTGTVTGMGDVIVYNEGESAWWSEDGPELTDAMREAVRDTYTWRKGIEERTAEIGNELVPKVQVLSDGNFIVNDCGFEQKFSADGEEVKWDDDEL
jgi:hypothetical protein